MTFLELAADRWSVRSYADIPVEQEKLDKIIKAGMLAPTACNFQPQKIYVVKDKAVQQKLREANAAVYDCPVVLVLAYDYDRVAKSNKREGYNYGETDASIVLTHMMLEAWELGVGSCWIGSFNDKTAEEVLKLPENIRVVEMMTLGYPAENAVPSVKHAESRAAEDMVEYI